MGKEKPILCEICYDEITDVKELLIMATTPLHKECHERSYQDIKWYDKFFSSNIPSNGIYGIVELIIINLVFIIFLFIFGFKYWPLVLGLIILTIYIRFYGWFKYERPLKKKEKLSVNDVYKEKDYNIFKVIKDVFTANFKIYIGIIVGGLIVDAIRYLIVQFIIFLF